VSSPLPTTKTHILNALVTQSHFSSPTWHDTWYGHHHPRRRILLLFVSCCISFNLCSWSFILDADSRLSWITIGDKFKRLEDCATDAYEAFRDAEFECNVDQSGAHVVDWSIPPDGFKSSMPASCLEIVQFGSNLTHGVLFDVEEEGDQPSQEPWTTLPDNYTWLTFEFMEDGAAADRNRHHSQLPSSYSAEDKAIITFTSSCKIRIDVPISGWQTQELDLIEYQEGNRKMIKFEDIAQGVINLSGVYYWLVNHLFLAVQLIIGACALVYNLMIYLSVMTQALIVVLLLRLFLPSSKYLTFRSTYWSLVLLTLTVNIEYVTGSIFAFISAIVYRNRQATIEWTFLLGVWWTAPIWEPNLVSLIEETLPLVDGLGIIKFVGKIIWAPIPNFDHVVCSKVLWVYAFVQSYPGRLPSFLTFFLVKKKAEEDRIQNETDSILFEGKIKQE